jgi:hypothetical protein
MYIRAPVLALSRYLPIYLFGPNPSPSFTLFSSRVRRAVPSLDLFRCKSAFRAERACNCSLASRSPLSLLPLSLSLLLLPSILPLGRTFYSYAAYSSFKAAPRRTSAHTAGTTETGPIQSRRRDCRGHGRHRNRTRWGSQRARQGGTARASSVRGCLWKALGLGERRVRASRRSRDRTRRRFHHRHSLQTRR